MTKLHTSRLAACFSTLMFTVCSATVSFAANLPDISPEQIAQDIERIYNPQTRQTEFIARDFDPFETDESVAGSVRLRSAQSATTLDGRYVSDGAFLDITTTYVTDSPDSYDIKGFERATFLSGQAVSFVSYDNHLVNCSTDTKTVVYDDGYYNGASHGYLGGLYRPYPYYRGFQSFGWSYAPLHGGGYSSFFSYPQFFNDGRTIRRDRNQSRVRNNDRNRDRIRDRLRDRTTGSAPRLGNVTPRLTGVPRINNELGLDIGSDNRVNDSGQIRRERDDVKRRSNFNNISTNRRGVRRVIAPSGSKNQNSSSQAQSRSSPTPASQGNTATIRRDTSSPANRSLSTSRERPKLQSRRTVSTSRSNTIKSNSRDIRPPKSSSRSDTSSRSNSSTRRSSSSSSSSRKPSSSVSRSTDKVFSSRNSERSKKVRRFFPMTSSYYRTNTYVDYRCLKEEKLTIHIPQERLDAARFDGFAIILLDNAGQEIPVFVPPNYVEGFRQAVGHKSYASQPQPQIGSSAREPIIYGGYPPAGR